MKNIFNNKKKIIILVISFIIVLLTGLLAFSYFSPNVSINILEGNKLSYQKYSVFPLEIKVSKDSKEILNKKFNGFKGEENLELAEGEYLLVYSIGNYQQEEVLLVDKTKPEISFNNNVYTNQKEYTLEFEVSELSTIVILDSEKKEINRKEVTSLTDSINFNLAEGENKFVISILDKAGNKTEGEVFVTLDTKKPDIEFISPNKTEYYKEIRSWFIPEYRKNPVMTIDVEFKLLEDNISSITLNGKNIELSEDSIYKVNIGLNGFSQSSCQSYYKDGTPVKTENKITIKVTDKANNINTYEKTFIVLQDHGNWDTDPCDDFMM